MLGAPHPHPHYSTQQIVRPGTLCLHLTSPYDPHITTHTHPQEHIQLQRQLDAERAAAAAPPAAAARPEPSVRQEAEADKGLRGDRDRQEHRDREVGRYQRDERERYRERDYRCVVQQLGGPCCQCLLVGDLSELQPLRLLVGLHMWPTVACV